MNNFRNVPQLLAIGIIYAVVTACKNTDGNQLSTVQIMPTGNAGVSPDTNPPGGIDTGSNPPDSEPVQEQEPSAAPIALQLNPTTLDLTPLASGTFEASLLDEDGNVVEGPVTWEATGGTIRENGVFEAGPELGEYTIIARTEGGLADTALISIKRPHDAPSTWIYPGENIQAVVDAQPAGTEFLIKTGTHRMQSIRPRTGDTLRGEPGAILSGAKELTEFFREGSYWVAMDQTQENPRHAANEYGDEVCWDGTDTLHQKLHVHEDSRGCILPEDLFFDDEPLRQVRQLSEVVPGTWYFDYGADRIYMYNDPTGRKVETSVLWDAVSGNQTHNVTITSLVVEKYANAGQHAAIHFVNSNGVIVTANEVRGCHGTGITIGVGQDGQIINNYVHHNGQMGLGGWGSVDLRVEGNEVSYNNYAGYKTIWEAGGAKFAKSTRISIKDNNVHHNEGKGLWTDGDDVESTIELNEVYDNSDHGIFREIGYSAVIRNNTVTNNGWHGIIIDSSPNVEVHNNIVRNNGWNWGRPLEQILARDSHNGESGNLGAREVRNLWVHNNIVEGEAAAGVTGPEQVFSNNYNNRFAANSYVLSSQKPFTWLGVFQTEYQWLTYGHDLNGTFNR